MNLAHGIVRATRDYEVSFASRVRVVRADLRAKHRLVEENVFVSVRNVLSLGAIVPRAAAQTRWRAKGLGIGDLHVENYGKRPRNCREGRARRKTLLFMGPDAPEEQKRSFANVFTRASAFFLVTSRRICRSTSVERNLKK